MPPQVILIAPRGNSFVNPGRGSGGFLELAEPLPYPAKMMDRRDFLAMSTCVIMGAQLPALHITTPIGGHGLTG